MIVIYHHNDLDGRSAASLILNSYKGNEDVKCIEVNYTKRDLQASDIDSADKVYILDYSINTNNQRAFEEISEKAESLVWIDHHRSSIETQAANPEILGRIKGIRLDGYSGALLTWYWLTYKTESSEYDETLGLADIESRLIHCPNWIRMVDDWDTFKSKLKSYEFMLGIEAYGSHAESDAYINLQSGAFSINKFIDAGEWIVKYERNRNRMYIDDFGFEDELNGIKCFVLNRLGNSKMFLERYKDYPFVCTCMYNGTRWVYSLYSDNKVNVGELARAFPGGGGHAGAAGFSTVDFIFNNK